MSIDEIIYRLSNDTKTVIRILKCVNFEFCASWARLFVFTDSLRVTTAGLRYLNKLTVVKYIHLYRLPAHCITNIVLYSLPRNAGLETLELGNPYNPQKPPVAKVTPAVVFRSVSLDTPTYVVLLTLGCIQRPKMSSLAIVAKVYSLRILKPSYMTIFKCTRVHVGGPYLPRSSWNFVKLTIYDAYPQVVLNWILRSK